MTNIVSCLTNIDNFEFLINYELRCIAQFEKNIFFLYYFDKKAQKKKLKLSSVFKFSQAIFPIANNYRCFFNWFSLTFAVQKADKTFLKESPDVFQQLFLALD